MKVQLFSDLHYEFFNRDNSTFGQVLVAPDVDVILMLGDIDLGPYVLQKLYNISQTWGKEVIYVPGNHEFYGQEMMSVLKGFNHNFSGIHILTGVEGFGVKEVTINDVRFVGGTLWTDFALYEHSKRIPTVYDAMRIGERSINDFNRIQYKGKTFTPEDSVLLHKNTLKQIKDVLKTPFDGKNVLLSHHGVHKDSIHVEYYADSRYLGSKSKLPGENPSWMMNTCFSSHLPDLLENFDYAFHGHTHKSLNFICNNVKKTKVMTNPRGYPLRMYDNIVFENSQYNGLFVVEI